MQYTLCRSKQFKSKSVYQDLHFAVEKKGDLLSQYLLIRLSLVFFCLC